MYTKVAKFEMATLIRPTDHLGNLRYTKTSTRFVPSYCNDNINMFDLLSMEYARKWYIEKEKFNKDLLVVKEKKKMMLKRHEIKHQHNIPRLRVLEKTVQKKTSKYDHIKSRYLDYMNNSRKDVCK